MRTLLIAGLVIAGCGSPSASPVASSESAAAVTSPLASCTEAYDITFTPGTTFEDVAADAVVSWAPPGVSFVATVERRGDALHIEGTLLNATDASATVDYLTGGVMGISTNPFQVDIDTLPTVATGPEIYPAPRRAVLPPRGNVTYRVTRCPVFPVHVRWTFTPWRGDAVRGEVTVR